jgi:hypothetical protein
MKCHRFKKRTGLGPHLIWQLKCQSCNFLFLRIADFNQSKPGAEPRVARQSNQTGQVLFGALPGKRTGTLSVFEPDIAQSDLPRGALRIIFVATKSGQV